MKQLAGVRSVASWFSTEDDVAFLGTFGNVRRCLLLSQLGRGALALHEKKPGIPHSILRWARQPP